jgi:signal transduction histidine kinase/CheY-like chemotaxis protein
MLSMMVITPLITTWFSRTNPILPQIRRFEALASLATLSAIVYAVFWTTLPRWNVFVILYILFACLFWIGLRLGMSTMATAMFLLTALGIAGSIIAQPTTASLGNQLLADELFVLLIAPIFFILASLVEEKRMVSNALAARADELEKAMEKLSRDDKSKNEFIAILAHELRNPLAPVVSSLQLLRLRSLDEESRQLIIRAEQQTSLMRRLLDDLLDVARITRKAFKLHKETIDLRGIIERCVSSTEDFLRSRQHTLSVDLPDEPIWLHIDPVRVEQIIVNLLNNAAKYTDPGGRISISARVENRQAIIIVSDTGIGIEATALEKIFAPFRQLRDTPRVGSGLGIGLALTRSLIHMHSGTITARSEGPGKGSAFIVQFPIADPPSAAPQAPNAEPETEEGPMRILVVDDNFAAAESLSRLLEHYGHTVRVAHTGGEVVARVSVFKPDVILLDIGLPDIDGYEVARRLRKNSVSAFTIALTGYGQEEDKAQAFAAGFNYHLTKPVGIADIQTALGKYREGSEMEEEEPEEETR